MSVPEHPYTPDMEYLNAILQALSGETASMPEYPATPEQEYLYAIYLAIVNGGGGTWDGITGKPFESIGSGLNVDAQGVLSAEAALETFVFRGYVSSAAPTGTIKAGTLWYQSGTMPTSFPIAVKTYDGEAWSTDTTEYTPEALEMWANLADDHGYYWFGSTWNIIDVNVEYDNVTIGVNAQGQLRIKASSADDGKFMRCVSGQASWQTVPSAENSTF